MTIVVLLPLHFVAAAATAAAPSGKQAEDDAIATATADA